MQKRQIRVFARVVVVVELTSRMGCYKIQYDNSLWTSFTSHRLTIFCEICQQRKQCVFSRCSHTPLRYSILCIRPRLLFGSIKFALVRFKIPGEIYILHSAHLTTECLLRNKAVTNLIYVLVRVSYFLCLKRMFRALFKQGDICTTYANQSS